LAEGSNSLSPRFGRDGFEEDAKDLKNSEEASYD
jgi:hypothetical protein